MAKEERDKPDRSKRQARRLWRRLSTGTAIVSVVVVAIVVGWFAYRAVADLPGGKLPDQGNLHITRETDPHVPYNSEPPTSGPHLPYIAPWGVHTRPIPRELQVHNLEDGGVVVQYSCECPELAERLAKIVRRYDKQVILAPYSDMKAKIALTAWTRLLTLDDFDEAQIVRFIGAYRGVDHHK